MPTLAVRSVLTSPLVRFDPDARAYIQAVERADGQVLETGVRQAIDVFVRGCKADGTWNAIKASCILAGARTLAGALAPLKGTAPTNFNFVSGDYNRKTGLVGNGSTKYLNSNRNNNADPQDNNHYSVFISTASSQSSGFPGIIGTQRQGGAYDGTYITYNGAGTEMYLANRSAGGITSSSRVAGFAGTNRTSASSYSARYSASNYSSATASIALTSTAMVLFAQRFSDGSTSSYCNVRLAFYSIGEALDLALLDARVTTLVNTLNSVIP